MSDRVPSSSDASATVGGLLAAGGHSFSFEFFPPKTDEGERLLWQAIRELEGLQPSFVSVTYGAGGSTRDRTVRVTQRVAEETTLLPMGHLTCVGSSVTELRSVIGSYAAAGVRNVLALRGDPPGGPGAPWEQHPEGLAHADELVALVRSLGDFSVGVAAFPERHPESASLDDDARVLLAKQEAGAEFAVTQMFFEASHYFAMVDRARALGCTIPVLPGIMPLTNIASSSGSPSCPARRSPTTWPPGSGPSPTTRTRCTRSASRPPRRCARSCSTAARRACTSSRSTARPRRARSTPVSGSRRTPDASRAVAGGPAPRVGQDRAWVDL